MENSNLHILLVDQDHKSTEIIVNYLKGNGYRVSVLTRGEAALELIKSGQASFNLILFSLTLPLLECFELLRDMGKANNQVGPIISMSTKVFESSLASSLDYGASDYIFKPISEESLGVIKSYLDHM